MVYGSLPVLVVELNSPPTMICSSIQYRKSGSLRDFIPQAWHGAEASVTVLPMETNMMRLISKAETSPRNQAESRESNLMLEEKIRARAYELYEQRKRGDGYDVEDWLDAEAELRGHDETQPKTMAA